VPSATCQVMASREVRWRAVTLVPRANASHEWRRTARVLRALAEGA
jgi:hypothetical protein